MPVRTAPKPAETREILVPKVQRRGLLVPIEGRSPLLVDNGASAVLEILGNEEKKRGPKAPKPPRDPNSKFQQSRYIGDDGQDQFPALGIKKSLVAAGFRFAEEQGTRLYGMLNIEAPSGFLPIISPEPPTRNEAFVRRGGMTPDVEWRAEYWPWRIDVPITFLAGHITEESVLNLFELAGESVGIGSWRVEKKGIYGRFGFIPGEVRPL